MHIATQELHGSLHYSAHPLKLTLFAIYPGVSVWVVDCSQGMTQISLIQTREETDTCETHKEGEDDKTTTRESQINSDAVLMLEYYIQGTLSIWYPRLFYFRIDIFNFTTINTHFYFIY